MDGDAANAEDICNTSQDESLGFSAEDPADHRKVRRKQDDHRARVNVRQTDRQTEEEEAGGC